MIDLNAFDILKSKLHVCQTRNTNNSVVLPKDVMRLVLSPLLGRWSVEIIKMVPLATIMNGSKSIWYEF